MEMFNLELCMVVVNFWVKYVQLYAVWPPVFDCLHYAIKNWRRGRPGNGANKHPTPSREVNAEE